MPGIYDTEIHFLQIKFYAIGLYSEAEISKSLSEWKGKSAEELLAEGSGFFSSFSKGMPFLNYSQFLKILNCFRVWYQQLPVLVSGALEFRF